MNAQSRGDQAAMNQAAKQAEDLRKQGATLGANEETAATKALKTTTNNPASKLRSALVLLMTSTKESTKPKTTTPGRRQTTIRQEWLPLLSWLVIFEH
jgi:hypothetical protein